MLKFISLLLNFTEVGGLEMLVDVCGYNDCYLGKWCSGVF